MDEKYGHAGAKPTGPYDSSWDTIQHIGIVRSLMSKVIGNLSRRRDVHDESKLVSPEKEGFDEMTPLLAGSTYGSEEYRGFLAKMKPTLDHHYAVNDHHPEHFPAPSLVGDTDHVGNRDRIKASRDAIEFGPHFGTEMTDAVMVMDEKLASMASRIRSMSLVQITEMLCDWKAATLRHNDGDIRKSIEINQRRFGYSDELKAILLNTLPVLED